MVRSYVQQIEELIFEELKGKNIELVDIEYRREKNVQMLRLFIDHEQGVNLQTCTDATKLVQKIIDENDIKYDHIEVSSPGLDRIIKKDKRPDRFIGKQVSVNTRKSYAGPKKIVGILKQVDDETLTVENNNNSYNISWEVVTTLRLHPDFK
ncbi:MAG TPA: hypothetical protein VFC73_00680 [Syntrophomonadaceae bacterium]|nr:hypothetical protein [Syntrophomonadaceae bacterium]